MLANNAVSVLHSSASELARIDGCSVLRPAQFLPGILAFTTCREPGVSEGAYASFNLAHHVGDDPQAVVINRQKFAQLCGGYTPKGWIEQIHGNQVVKAEGITDGCTADAMWSDQPNSPCVVLTADCLPIVLAARNKPLVAVLHAGWRGLVADIIGATVSALPVAPEELHGWLGPAIGPSAFEVGPEVYNTFLNTWGDAIAFCFALGEGDRYLADLWQLAAWRLEQLGVSVIRGGGWGTYNRPRQFYSYRRDGATGRMATVAMITPF